MERNVVNFELKQEHVDLAARLNFKLDVSTEYGDPYIPTISRKRPFWNSHAMNDVLDIIGRERDADDRYRPEDVDYAEDILIGLPVALEIILSQRTFEPGIYQVDRFCAYFTYKRVCNYKILRGAADEAESYMREHGVPEDMIDTMRGLCLNITGDDDPWKVTEMLKRSPYAPLQDIACIFEKHGKDGR